MNPQSSVLHDFPAEARSVSAPSIPATTLFFWSVRRELWEHRGVYLAPTAVAALIVVGFLIGITSLRMHFGGGLSLPPTQQAILYQPYNIAAGLLMAVTFIVAVFYSLHALYDERRDRSILFWKSLPISDLNAVLAKAAIPILVLPFLTFVLTILVQAAMILIQSIALAGSGLDKLPAAHAPLLLMSGMLFFHLIAIHGLWYAPVYGWLLLVSAWSRRAPFLWAILPPLGIVIFEKIAFNTHYFAHMLGNRMGGAPGGSPFLMTEDGMNMMSHLDITGLFAAPGFWLGLAATAAFLAAATRLRHIRLPI